MKTTTDKYDEEFRNLKKQLNDIENRIKIQELEGKRSKENAQYVMQLKAVEEKNIETTSKYESPLKNMKYKHVEEIQDLNNRLSEGKSL